MMKAAAEDGADYLYRVNDDTQFVGAHWPVQALRALRSFDPLNVGLSVRCATRATPRS